MSQSKLTANSVYNSVYKLTVFITHVNMYKQISYIIAYYYFFYY